jgi:hypothetical protein
MLEDEEAAATDDEDEDEDEDGCMWSNLNSFSCRASVNWDNMHL